MSALWYILRPAQGPNFCLSFSPTLYHNGLACSPDSCGWLAVFGRVPMSWKVAVPPLIKCGLWPATAASVAFNAAIMKANKQQILLPCTAHKNPFGAAHLEEAPSLSWFWFCFEKMEENNRGPIKFHHVSHVCRKKEKFFLLARVKRSESQTGGAVAKSKVMLAASC